MKWIGVMVLWIVGRLIVGAIAFAILGACLYGATITHAIVFGVMSNPVLKAIALCFCVGYFVCRIGESKDKDHITY